MVFPREDQAMTVLAMSHGLDSTDKDFDRLFAINTKGDGGFLHLIL